MELNATLKYLASIMMHKLWKDDVEFMMKFHPVTGYMRLRGAYIGDHFYENPPSSNYVIYVIKPYGPRMDGKYLNKADFYKEFLLWLNFFRKRKYYRDDYAMGYNKNKYALVVDYGRKYDPIFEHFKKGNFSKMYKDFPDIDISMVLSDSDTSKAVFKTLKGIQDKKYLKENMRNMFGDIRDVPDISENDIYIPRNEILNYGKQQKERTSI